MIHKHITKNIILVTNLKIKEIKGLKIVAYNHMKCFLLGQMAIIINSCSICNKIFLICFIRFLKGSISFNKLNWNNNFNIS